MKTSLLLNDSPARRGIRLNGTVIRDSRRIRGWSQFDLAGKAGVAERTVRNAERGAPVKAAVADYLAGALEIEVRDLLATWVSTPERPWTEFAADLHAALRQAAIGSDPAPLLSHFAPEISIRCEAASSSLRGEFQGLEGAVCYAASMKRWFDERRIQWAASHFDRIEGGGDLLFVRGRDTLIRDAGAPHQIWFANFYRLEAGRIRVFEQFLGT